MELRDLQMIAQIIYYVAISVTGPLALITFIANKRKDQLAREEATFRDMDERYIAFQKLCLKYPHLDVFDIADKTPRELTDNEKKQELIIFTMLFSLFEKAYLMYKNHDEAIRNRQWTGWEEYITHFCRRDNFQAAWRISGSTFDSEYQDYIARVLDKASKKP